ncbi:sporulation histidine kinase inhibitor Sda [Salipaludibacillus daqingensis]|uniref:sporulation histidine kinase inhibitor Sda n=1 Tax=Salipaludibacillus daqingensis TaxID=3041001 RepID=UPI002475D76B|nr:sporulation histidine kinase inhibitor Sda [Salipaludibacillus daqingensis]
MSLPISHLKDEQLIEAYKNAKNLGLDIEFVTILKEELKNRNITLDSKSIC